MNPAHSPHIGTIRPIGLDSQLVNLPSFTSRVSDEWDALALFQEIASPLHATFAEEGKMLLAGLFGPNMQADGNGFLSPIRSQMLVSSLERYDGELLEKSQLLCGSSRQSSVLRILEFALYRMSNNLLSAEATDEFTRWLIKQQQNGLLTSFLKTKIPTVHACATKILESVLRIGQADFLELMIDSGLDISPMKGVWGGRNLVHAALQGNLQIVQMLLKNGADVNILPSEQYPRTALQAATSKGHAHIVQFLLKAGAYVDAVSPFHYLNNALSEAVDRNNIELVRILLTAGANIDNCIIRRELAIEYSALYMDDDELHQILLSASSKEYSSITSLGVIEAASTGSQALYRYLVEKGKPGALIHEAVLDRALIAASDDSRYDAVISLLGIGVDSNCFLSSNIGIPLEKAIYRGDFELIKILLRASAEVNTWGVLTRAISHDMERPHGIRMVQFLLDEGANFDTQGEAELQYAAMGGHFKAVKYLVSSGVNVNTEARICNFYNLTVLQLAVLSGEIEMVKLLLDAGADVNTKSGMQEHQTALEIAIRNEDFFGPERLGMVKVLLAAGADVNIPDEERIGASMLQIAIANGDEELVSMLLKEGADVNSPPIGKEGRSPIQEAAIMGNLSLINLLLEAGADINDTAGDY